MKKVIAFAGSNSKNSINHQLIQASALLAEGFEVEVIKLTNYEVPMFGMDLEAEQGIPQGTLDLKAKMETADGFILSSPEHNGSFPAFLKNTLDWLSRAGEKTFQDKPTLLMATSPGPRGGGAILAHMLQVLPYAGAQVTGGFSLPSFHEHFVNGEVQGEHKKKLEEELSKLGVALG